MKLAALIPALDCSATVSEVVRGTLREVEHALVVDDGSSDDTAAAAVAAGARVLRHGSTLGKGAALLTGLRALASGGWSHAVTIDGDGQHLPTEIPKLRGEAAAHPGAVILGARFDRSGAAGVNRFGNDFADWWVRWAAGQPIADTQCGFRVYPIDATLALDAVGSR
ncbi:MAG: hypothetical protein QOD06_1735, partial [Candidatus Binatota bacterium]|nr:hypothetical protein [Candidatus Binatota bacterium]